MSRPDVPTDLAAFSALAQDVIKGFSSDTATPVRGHMFRGVERVRIAIDTYNANVDATQQIKVDEEFTFASVIPIPFEQPEILTSGPTGRIVAYSLVALESGEAWPNERAPIIAVEWHHTNGFEISFSHTENPGPDVSRLTHFMLLNDKRAETDTRPPVTFYEDQPGDGQRHFETYLSTMCGFPQAGRPVPPVGKPVTEPKAQP
ncbi:MAG: hypothetical protein EB059_08355 [Alphaproteobacteria bacterium]|nr:hypothetical protein [Alphaproteobacteria bacterium]